MFLGLVAWTVIGVIVGFIVSKIVNLRGDDPRLGIAAAAVGAIAGGIVYTVVSGVAVSAWNPWGLLFTAVGGLVGAVTWHAVRSRYISHDSYTVRKSY